MSLFASFHTSQTHFSFFFRELPHPPCPPKGTWHLFHQYISWIFRKGPGEEVGLTPWPLILSWALVLSEPTFRVFSFSLKFTVVHGRHQKRLFALLTRCRPHSIIHNMVYRGEISRPPCLSEGVFMSVFIPSSEENAFTHLERFHNLFAQSWRGINIPQLCGLTPSQHVTEPSLEKL